MKEFFIELLRYLPAILGAAATVAATFIGIKNKGTNKGVFLNAVNTITKILPELINFSEILNEGKPGEEKKAFLMNFIQDLFLTMGTVADESTLEQFSAIIDNTVKLTKQIHTEERTENDIEEYFGNE